MRDPWDDVVEAIIAAVAITMVLYSMCSMKREARPQRTSLVRFVYMDGCYEAATAPPWSGDQRDWICAV